MVGTPEAPSSLNLMQIRGAPFTLAEDRIVAVGLLTQHDVELLGHGFSRLWPVDETPCFTDLLRAIDEADRELKHSRREDRRAETGPSLVPGGGRY